MNFVVWKEIVGYDKKYEVSTDGRVREESLDGGLNDLKQSRNIAGYMFVELLKNGKSYSIAVDCLVASAFIENPSRKEFVEHKNKKRYDNNIENLRWVGIEDDLNKSNVWRPSEEHKAMIRLKNAGKRNGNAKKVYQYSLKGDLIKCWDCIADAEKSLNISGISRACRKPLSTAGGYLWCYNETVKPLFENINI